MKQHPELETFHHKSHTEADGSIMIGSESIGNFVPLDGSWDGIIPYDLIRDTVQRVPGPYGVNELALVYHGIGMEAAERPSGKMRMSSDGTERSVGNYIYYVRSHYGDEKHSYVYFSMERDKAEAMRRLFLDFAEIIPGTYEGTECLR